jgi:NADH:ubiquinone oxidoreductase subunit 6 (subunit J)
MLAAINWHSFLFLLSGGLAAAFALGVLFSGNIVRMAFYLIVSLAATAALFILAGATFVGAMQIMIYVGGTLVLLVFGVMLTATSSFVSLKTQGSDWVLASIVGGALLALLMAAALSVPEWRRADTDSAAVTQVDDHATALGWGLIGVRVDQTRQADEGLRQGMSGYLLPFEIISVHLLVVLIAAAYLARTRRRVGLRNVLQRAEEAS